MGQQHSCILCASADSVALRVCSAKTLKAGSGTRGVESLVGSGEA